MAQFRALCYRNGIGSLSSILCGNSDYLGVSGITSVRNVNGETACRSSRSLRVSEGIINGNSCQFYACTYGVAIYVFNCLDSFTIDGQALDAIVAACFARTVHRNRFDIRVASRGCTIYIDPFGALFQCINSSQALCVKISRTEQVVTLVGIDSSDVTAVENGSYDSYNVTCHKVAGSQLYAKIVIVRTEFTVILRVLVSGTAENTGNGSRIFVYVGSNDQIATSAGGINYGYNECLCNYRREVVFVRSRTSEAIFACCSRSESIFFSGSAFDLCTVHTPLIYSSFRSIASQLYRTTYCASIFTADHC